MYWYLRSSEEGVKSTRAGLTGSFEAPDMGEVNVGSLKSSKPSSLRRFPCFKDLLHSCFYLFLHGHPPGKRLLSPLARKCETQKFGGLAQVHRIPHRVPHRVTRATPLPLPDHSVHKSRSWDLGGFLWNHQHEESVGLSR